MPSHPSPTPVPKEPEPAVSLLGKDQDPRAEQAERGRNRHLCKMSTRAGVKRRNLAGKGEGRARGL